MSQTLRVGYYLDPKKIKNLDWDSFRAAAKVQNIELTAIDPTKPIENNNFNLLIVKPQKELNNITWESAPSPVSVSVIENISKFLAQHHGVAVIDPLEGQKQLISRESMKNLLEHVGQHTKVVKFPHSVVLQEGDPIVLPDCLSFPVICKSVVAGGSEASHHMGIVFNKEGIQEFKKPVIVQQLVNHDATIFKAFVIGDFVSYVRKDSLINFAQDPSRKTVMFDSQAFTELMGEPTAPEPGKDVVPTVARAISKETGLTLYGFDMITDTKTGEHYVIDINYFPSYRGIDDFYGKLVTLMMKKISEKKSA